MWQNNCKDMWHVMMWQHERVRKCILFKNIIDLMHFQVNFIVYLKLNFTLISRRLKENLKLVFTLTL